MIVIATNNGQKMLPLALDAIAEFGAGGHAVLVVDTGSTDQAFLEYLKALPERYPTLDIDSTATPYKGYDSGAYIWAYRNYQAETYLFTQDSIRPKHAGWIEAFEAHLTPAVDCVPWMAFPLQWDNLDQVNFVRQNYRTEKNPPLGIFGPIFFVRRSALEEMEARGYLEVIPANKIQQQAMERGWATGFALCDVAMRPLESIFNEATLRGDHYVYMTKTLVVRH